MRTYVTLIWRVICAILSLYCSLAPADSDTITSASPRCQFASTKVHSTAAANRLLPTPSHSAFSYSYVKRVVDYCGALILRNIWFRIRSNWLCILNSTLYYFVQSKCTKVQRSEVLKNWTVPSVRIFIGYTVLMTDKRASETCINRYVLVQSYCTLQCISGRRQWSLINECVY